MKFPMLNFGWKQKTKKEIAPLKEKSTPIIPIKKVDKNFIVKAIGVISSYSANRNDFQDPEFDLEEISLAADSDSYINISLKKYNQLIYKAGYTLKSKNDKAVEYIKTRFKIMGFMTGKPVDILFQEIAEDLVKYSNAFLLKSRVDKIGFNVKANIIDGLKPVGGYFRAAPDHMRIKRDKTGTVIGYEQWNESGDVKHFQPSEVIHFYMDREAGYAYGRPRIASALEDVKLLRRIEGNILSLIYRFAIPIYQWKIGLPERPASQPEIDEAKIEVENSALDGIFFTNEATEIKAIGAEGNALDASNYLAYFEKRVFTALGVSESQMGRNSSSTSADSMEAQVHDTVKHIQRTLRLFIENFILSELLLEGGFDPITKQDDWVRYEFNEISLDTKIKIENHEMVKFQSNIITFEECRTDIGMESEADEERLYNSMITKQTAFEQNDHQTENAIKLANVNAENAQKLSKINNQDNQINSTTGGKSGNQGTKTVKPNKDASNKNTPENQHGKTSVKIKESFEKIEKNKNSSNKIYKYYEKLRNDITETKDINDINIVMQITRSDILKETIAQCEKYYALGSNQAINDLGSKVSKDTKYDLTPLKEDADQTLKKILNDVKKSLKEIDLESSSSIKTVFDTYKYRLDFMIDYLLKKAYWFGYLKQGAAQGNKKAYVIFHSEKDEEQHEKEINLKDFNLDMIPAFHANCKCQLTFKKMEVK